MKFRRVNDVLLIALALALSNCKDQSTTEIEIMQDQAVCVSLTQHLRLLEMRLAQAGPSVQTVEQVGKSIDAMTQQSDDLRKQRDALASSISQTQKDFDQLKKNTIAQKREYVMGKKFDTFITNDQTYKSVTIKAVSDAGLHLVHATGSARVKPMQLSAEQRHEFGLDIEQANAILSQEAKQQQQYIARSEKEIAEYQAKQMSQIAAENAKTEAQTRVASISSTYRAVGEGGTLSKTPKTTNYRVRSRPTTYFYNFNYNYGNPCRPYTVTPAQGGFIVRPVQAPDRIVPFTP